MAQKSGGKRSWRVAAHWPHLMNAGPAASSTSLHASRAQSRAHDTPRAQDRSSSQQHLCLQSCSAIAFAVHAGRLCARETLSVLPHCTSSAH